MAEKQPVNMKLPWQRGPRSFAPVEKAHDVRGTLARLLRYFGNEKLLLLSLLVAVIFGVLCSVTAPSLQSRAIDAITIRENDRLPLILALMLTAYGLYGLCSFLQARLSAHLSQRIVKRLRADLFERIVGLPVSYLDGHSHGDIMSRMTNDVESISATASQSITSLFAGALTIVGTITMMSWYCWQLTLLSCTTIIATVLTTKALSRAMRRFYRRQQTLLGRLNGTVEETVVGYKTVVAYNRQQPKIDEFDKISDELTRTSVKSEILGTSMGPLMNTLNNAGFVIITAFGAWFALNGYISVGVISAFIIYAKQFGRPINELAQLYGQIQSAIAGAERVFGIMDEPAEDKSGSHDMKSAKGVVSFRNVDFSYSPGKQVLHGFSLEIRAGQKVALVGATGSGKTTVVNLLMRFYDVDSGEILIDGTNIKDIDCNELRRSTAIVLQDTVLFSDTVRNNLCYSNPNATQEQMEEAARRSNCEPLVRHLPQGYDTLLTESGANLSQGQRQLLSIGQAFLAEPRILILDEATSSVDTRTEKQIQDAMVGLMRDRTSLIIAHRLSTIRDADLIVVMDSGRIVETGDHRSLLAAHGRYHELYMAQFAGSQT